MYSRESRTWWLSPAARPGAETLAERFAQERGFGVKQYLAEWKLYGRGAKLIRNTQMIDAADHAVVFWDGKNKGVAEMIEKAEGKGIPVEVVRFSTGAPG